MHHGVCNYCGNFIAETHLWTIRNGNLYHWECVKEMKETVEKFINNVVTTPESESKEPEEPEKSFWKRLFRRKK